MPVSPCRRAVPAERALADSRRAVLALAGAAASAGGLLVAVLLGA